LRDFQR